MEALQIFCRAFSFLSKSLINTLLITIVAIV
jgi:hypothetical protein